MVKEKKKSHYLILLPVAIIFYYFSKISKMLCKVYLQFVYDRMKLGIKINGTGVILGLKRLDVGENVHLGDGYHIDARGGVVVGDNTHVSRNLVIYSTSHNYNGCRVPYDETLRERPVHIGKNVWIGMNVVILPGSSIADGAVIGAGAVVSGSIGECEVFVAARGGVLGTRDVQLYNKNTMEGNVAGANGYELDVRK